MKRKNKIPDWHVFLYEETPTPSKEVIERYLKICKVEKKRQEESNKMLEEFMKENKSLFKKGKQDE